MTNIWKGKYVISLIQIYHTEACESVAIYFLGGLRCYNVRSELRYVRSEPRYVRLEPRYVRSEPSFFV